MGRAMGVLMTGVVLVVAGCGSSSSSSRSSAASSPPSSSTAASTPSTSSTTSSASAASAGGGETVHLSAVAGKLAFNTRTLKAKAGIVTLSMSNPSSFPHGISVQGNGLDKDGHVVQPGGTSTVTVRLKPGTYTFYCPVPGHRQAGMQGKLTVS